MRDSTFSGQSIYLRIATLFFCTGLSVWCTSALAWDCSGSQAATAESATLVFEGKVTGITTLHEKGSDEIIGRTITFATSRILRGDYQHTVTLNTGTFGDSPGYPFLCGEQYRVYAIETNTETRTDACFPNRPLGDTPGYEEMEKIIFSGNTENNKFQFYVNKLTKCGK